MGALYWRREEKEQQKNQNLKQIMQREMERGEGEGKEITFLWTSVMSQGKRDGVLEFL